MSATNKTKEPVIGFIRNFDNKANISVLGVKTVRRGESRFTFYRIGSELAEALVGQMGEAYACADRWPGSERAESGHRPGPLPNRTQDRHG